MAAEAIDQMKSDGSMKPTHVYMSGLLEVYWDTLKYYKDEPPVTVIAEPENAACIYKSALADDGKPHSVSGDLNTIMAGLACGEPNTVTWPILRDFAKVYVSCPDYVAAKGMRILAAPSGNDKKVISGESGAVGLGLLTLFLEKEELKPLKEKLKLNENL